MASTRMKKTLPVQIGTKQYSVIVESNQTIFDVRGQILTPGFLPHDVSLTSWSRFSIAINNKFLSRQDELSTLAFAVIDEKHFVSLHEETEDINGSSILGKRTASSPNDSSLEPPTTTKKSRSTTTMTTTTSLNLPQKGEEHREISTLIPKGDSINEGQSYHQSVSAFEVTDGDDPHTKSDIALKRTKELLLTLRDKIASPQNKSLCTEPRRQELLRDIDTALNKTPPDIIIGCLGQTGVGKSSALNALLEEPNILPTSGSRGCTATPVEVRYNRDFDAPTELTPVYKGQVEFVSIQEWMEELKMLLDECCKDGTQNIMLSLPDNEIGKAAWTSVDQVYGRGTMKSYAGKNKADVVASLSKDERINGLLKGPGGERKTVCIYEGQVDSEEAKLLLKNLGSLKGSLRRNKKKWASNFRAKIAQYVYRNGKDKELWPLVRKTILHGPWVVLRTGGVLVDLPGVHDANAARAKVAQSYIQNCTKLWIFGKIQRAVSDRIAKDLMGNHFRHNLLMDGNYANCSVVCTQSDEVEAAEIMADHADVASKIPGRWEEMSKLKARIDKFTEQLSEVVEKTQDLDQDLQDAKQESQEIGQEMGSMKKSNSQETGYLQELEELLKKNAIALSAKESQMMSLTEEKRKLELEIFQMNGTLQVQAAAVRNEYSTQRLQKDFRLGLESMTGDSGDRKEHSLSTHNKDGLASALPEGFQLEVHCISSTDYGRLKGLSACGLKPKTFTCVDQTQIPSLQTSVHKAAMKLHELHVSEIANAATDMLFRLKLCTTESPEQSFDSRQITLIPEKQAKRLPHEIASIASSFAQKMQSDIDESLKPALIGGAGKGRSASLITIKSWGSKGRDTEHRYSSLYEALTFSTYEATMRRNGTFFSKTRGEHINFNLQLCDPMVSAFSKRWWAVMEVDMKCHLDEAESNVHHLCRESLKLIGNEFIAAGFDVSRAKSMTHAAARSCWATVNEAFLELREVATVGQRELSRSLLAMIRHKMTPHYKAAYAVDRGHGRFQRMKDIVEGLPEETLGSMFQWAATELLKQITALVLKLAQAIRTLSAKLHLGLTKTFASCCQHHGISVDPALKADIASCRGRFQPFLEGLFESHRETMDLVGVAWRADKINEEEQGPGKSKSSALSNAWASASPSVNLNVKRTTIDEPPLGMTFEQFMAH